MKKFMLSVVFLWLVAHVAIAQPYIIEYQYDDQQFQEKVLKQVVFKNSATNEILRTLDVEKLNPFAGLPYPLHKKYSEEYEQAVYDLSGKTMKEVLPENVTRLYHYDHPEKVSLDIGHYYIMYYEQENYLSIVFRFIVGYVNQNIAYQSKLFVFNRDGSEYFRLTDSEVNIDNVNIDKSGKYLCFAYGVAGPDTNILAPGVRVFRLDQNLSYLDQPGELFQSVFFEPGFVSLYLKGPEEIADPTLDIRVIDLEKPLGYKHLYPESRMLDFQTFNKDGLIFKDGSIDHYGTDFSREELSWKRWNTVGK